MARASKPSGAKDGKAGKAKKSQSGKTTTTKRAASRRSSADSSSGNKGTQRRVKSGKTSTKSSAPRAAAKKKAVTKSTKSASTKSGSSGSSTAKAAADKKAKKAPAKKAAVKKKSPFPAKFLKEMHALLGAERDTYERQAAQLRAEAESLVEDLDPGDVQFDEESGEGDTIAVERNRDLALASKAQEMIGEIDHALSKFELGTYGICEVSGEPIPTERLEAIPWAREKVEFKVGGFGRR